MTDTSSTFDVTRARTASERADPEPVGRSRALRGLLAAGLTAAVLGTAGVVLVGADAGSAAPQLTTAASTPGIVPAHRPTPAASTAVPGEEPQGRSPFEAQYVVPPPPVAAPDAGAGGDDSTDGASNDETDGASEQAADEPAPSAGPSSPSTSTPSTSTLPTERAARLTLEMTLPSIEDAVVLAEQSKVVFTTFGESVKEPTGVYRVSVGDTFAEDFRVLELRHVGAESRNCAVVQYLDRQLALCAGDSVDLS